MRRKNRRMLKSEALDKVTTAAECARLFFVARSTVTYAINANLVAYKKVGGVVLIDIESARALWKNPQER